MLNEKEGTAVMRLIFICKFQNLLFYQFEPVEMLCEINVYK